jgi:hypothetical protein
MRAERLIGPPRHYAMGSPAVRSRAMLQGSTYATIAEAEKINHRTSEPVITLVDHSSR